MSISDQIDALQKKAADLKSSFDQTRHETNEQVKARLDKAKADIAIHNSAIKEQAGQAADRTQSQWKSLKSDAAAKREAMQERIQRKRDEHDVKNAERDAENSEQDADDALDYAVWALEQAQLAVLDAADARSWANELAAASPST